jgi:hypothetical protein
MADKFMVACGICGAQFQFGPHRYDGRHISTYKLTVCGSCYDANWDGWAPHWEPILIKHLNTNGIPIPSRNSKGWLPRE